MTQLSYFQVTGTWEPSATGGTVEGDVTFTMLIDNNGVLAAPTLDNPAIVVPTVIQSTISNGVLVPVSLLANTAPLNISGSLVYTVTFSNVYYNETHAQPAKLILEPITFVASSDTTPIDLVFVTPTAGSPVTQTVLPSTLVAYITDATTLGRELMQATDAPTALSELGIGTQSGLLKSNGSGVVTAAISGTDYMRAHWVNVLDHGADPTGVADSTTAFTAAIAALPSTGGWVYAPTGNYKISSALSLQQSQGLRGDGKYMTVLSYTGSGPCIAASYSLSSYSNSLRPGIGLGDLNIDGTSAAAGAIGLQMGSATESYANNLVVSNFSGAGSMGIYFYNTTVFPGSNVFCDRLRFKNIVLNNNTNGVVFDDVAHADGSGTYAYCEFDFYFYTLANQNCVTLQNGANINGGRLVIHGDIFAGVTNTGWVLGIDPVTTSSPESKILFTELNVAVECDGTGVGHRTLVMGTTGSFSGTGVLSFVGGFTGASIATTAFPRFGMAGFINDPVLGTMLLADGTAFQGGSQWNVFGSATTTMPTTINPRNSDVHEYVLPSGNRTVTSIVTTGLLRARKMEILLHQPASGAAGTVTWPSNVTVIGNLSTTNNAVDKVLLTYYPSDSAWYGVVVTGMSPLLQTVAVKSANYTATPNQIIPCDLSGGAFAVTLPTAPVDGTTEVIKIVKQAGTPNTLTFDCGGSDVLNVAGGSTSGTMTLLNQGIVAQYSAASAIWYVISTDAPLSQLDARYQSAVAANVVPATTDTYALGTVALGWSALFLGGPTYTAKLVPPSGAAANQTLTLPAPTTDFLVSRTSTDTLTGKTLTNPTINGYAEGGQALGTVTTSKTIPALTNGTVCTATLTNGSTCAFTLPSPVAGTSFVLFVFQPSSTGTGLATFTTPSGSLFWPAAGAPIMTQGANMVDIYTFISPLGTNWYGSYSQGY